MKYICILFIALAVSCNTESQITEADKKEFEMVAKEYQANYIKGSAHLEEILSPVDQNIQMWENGKIWSYDDMVKFGPHLPAKNVIDIYDQQKLLSKDLGYDFVSQLYISGQSGDTLRETVSRIWKKTTGEWKIVQMNNLIQPE